MPDRRGRTQLSKRKWHPKKRMNIWIFVVLISLCASGSYGYIKSNSRVIRPYLYARWGMSLEQCEQMVNFMHAKSKAVLKEGQEVICTISDYEGRKDIDALVSFICRENGLEEVEVYIISRKDTTYTRQKFIKEYVKWLDAACGNHTKDSVLYTWLKDNTHIQLIDYPNKPVRIRYRWVNKA